MNPAAQKVVEAIRKHLSLDDTDGDQLYEGTIDPAELAQAAVDALQLAEETEATFDFGERSRLVGPWFEDT